MQGLRRQGVRRQRLWLRRWLGLGRLWWLRRLGLGLGRLLPLVGWLLLVLEVGSFDLGEDKQVLSVGACHSPAAITKRMHARVPGASLVEKC